MATTPAGIITFPGVKLFAQRRELAHMRVTPDYTHVPSVIDFEGADVEEIDGEAPLFEGLTVLPTPGHSPGHQSMVVQTRAGRVVLAGQALGTATEFARHRYSHERAEHGLGHPPYPDWVPAISRLDPWRVYFAHDRAVWQRDALEPIG